MKQQLIPLILVALSQTAAADVPDCETLAAAAGAELGLPEDLLPAIARTEAGITKDERGHRAWPWTLNEAGHSMYFDTQDEALAYLRNAVDRGVTNIDVGCMQINWRWHHDNFGSLAEMMDPAANTRYGATFLAELYRRLGDWDQATGHYHSNNPMRGSNYAATVLEVRDVIIAEGPRAVADAPVMVAAAHLGFLNGTGAPLVKISNTVTAYLAADTEAPEMPAPTGEAIILAANTEMRDRREAPAHLQAKWDKVELFRQVLKD